MTIPAFLEVVEAKTKLASILPCLIGLGFSLAYFHQLNGLNSLLFFVALLCIDMATTAINNLMDYQHAVSDDYREHTNVLGRRQVAPKTVLNLIVTLLFAALVIGLVLVWRTQWVLFFIGGFCVLIGIFYTSGPLPLNRLPLGEVFSGVTMGFGIPFLMVFVNVLPQSFVAVTWQWPNLFVSGSWVALVTLILVCVMPMGTIANVMLANNLCDLKEDEANHRTTLPMYLTHGQAMWLYASLAYGGFVAILIAVALGLLHWPALLVFVALPLVWRNTQQFLALQDKAKTFKTALLSLLAENIALILALLIDWGLSR
ncbi:1,4-dihydroxy-2-naphthoate polyprenyltransferase [Lacticaseibacillus porcinae]|uniref:1,4-dihydroxy-2-naphthoate polyprenyltransferase n=1 Tax=Lacticaseibacillus porcinae TaxID=1123687 RepID=UPI000F76D6E6|nr:1,4-dihydroxy-2-naphthoate polyprenyltransferase [Lacticaseibacillus porcinae]